MGKLNHLLQALPRGSVVTSARLRDLAVSPQLAKRYVDNGWLVRLGKGAFARAGDRIEWLGGLYALQTQLCRTVRVGARTALELQAKRQFLFQLPELLDDYSTEIDYEKDGEIFTDDYAPANILRGIPRE